MGSFDESWKLMTATGRGKGISPRLRPLLRHAYEQITRVPLDLTEIKASLEGLLLFLSAEGRTSENCFATDLFFNPADWDVDWEAFPESLTEIIGDIGGALHDTVDYPEIAKSFRGLPEDLLERLRAWNPS